MGFIGALRVVNDHALTEGIAGRGLTFQISGNVVVGQCDSRLQSCAMEFNRCMDRLRLGG
jgi:phosphotransferase system IIA component